MRAPVLVLAAFAALAGGRAAAPERAPVSRPGPTELEVLNGSIDFYRRRLERDSGSFLSATQLSDLYMMRFGATREMADVWRADTVLSLALRAFPRFPEAHGRLAGVHIARHEFPEALAAARYAYDHAPRRAANAALFDAYFEVGRYDSAAAALNRMDGESFGFQLRKARYASALGHIDVAEHAMQRACNSVGTLGPSLVAWCDVRLADLDAQDGRFERARGRYDLALRSVPGYSGAMYGLAKLASARGALMEAESHYRALAARSDGVSAHVPLRRLALLSGDTAEARRQGELFERRATMPVWGRGYWAALARFHAEAGRFDTAIALARRDLAQRSGPEAYTTLGVVRYLAGDAQGAGRALDSAMTWGPPSAEGAYYAGLARLALRDRSGGARFLRLALEQPQGLEPDQLRRARRMVSARN